MATWQEIGLSSFYAAQTLYEQKQFRSSVSRSYYAVFQCDHASTRRGRRTLRSAGNAPASGSCQS